MSSAFTHNATPRMMARLRRVEATLVVSACLRVGFFVLVAIAAAWPG